VIVASAIAVEYRPGGGVTVNATPWRLRDRGLVSARVAEHPRGVGGRVPGVWRVYSALNLDAARAGRGDDEATRGRSLTPPWESTGLDDDRFRLRWLERLAGCGADEDQVSLSVKDVEFLDECASQRPLPVSGGVHDAIAAKNVSTRSG